MTIVEKLYRYLKDYIASTSNTGKLRFSGCSRRLVAELFQYVQLHPFRKNDVIVPTVLCVRDETIFTDTEEGTVYNWHCYPTRDAAVSAMRQDSGAYRETGWAIGGNNFCTTVRNEADSFLILYGTNASIGSLDDATAEIGFPTDIDSSVTLFNHSVFQQLLPNIGRTDGNNLWKEHATLFGKVFEEYEVEELWSVAEHLCRCEDSDSTIPLRNMEAVLGLPYSGRTTFDAQTLKQQIKDAKALCNYFATPSSFAEFIENTRAVVAEDGGDSAWVEALKSTVETSRTMDNAYCDECFHRHFGMPLTASDISAVPTWWDKLTPDLLKVVIEETSGKAAFEVELASNCCAGSLTSKAQPLVLVNGATFRFKDDSGKLNRVDIYEGGKKPLEEDLPISEEYNYFSESDKLRKPIKLKFVGKGAAATDEVSFSHDIVVLEHLLAGCYVTLSHPDKIKKVKAFAPKIRSANDPATFEAFIAVKQTSGKIGLEFHFAPGFDMDVGTLSFETGEDGTQQIDSYIAGSPATCVVVLHEGSGHLRFAARYRGKKRQFDVEIKIAENNKQVLTKPSRFAAMQWQAISARDCAIEVDSTSVASRISQRKIVKVCEADDEAYIGYPVLLATDTLQEWTKLIGGEKTLTSIKFDGFDRRPSFELWSASAHSTEGTRYFSARKAFFTHLRNQLCSGNAVVIEELELRLLEERASGDDAYGEGARLLEEYLSAYRSWLESDYENAIVTDTYWCYVNVDRDGIKALRDIPDFILLPPEHPLRITWQFMAQRVLWQLINRDKPSILASSFDSSVNPEYLRVPCLTAMKREPIASEYYAIRSSSDTWGVFLGREIDRQIIDSVAKTIFNEEFGITLHGIKRLITKGEVETALKAVREVCAAKDILNISIATGEAVDICNSAILNWCRFMDDESQRGLRNLGPRGVNVYCQRNFSESSDLRASREASGNRLLWYSKPKECAKSDITIAALTGVDTRFVEPIAGESQGGISACGGLLRYRARVRGQSDGQTFAESRTAKCIDQPDLDNLENTFVGTIDFIENSHFDGSKQNTFLLCQSGVRELLRSSNSYYYAMSSADIDQACLMNDTSNGDELFYLWDYTLPDILSESKNTEGFYLLASDNTTLCDAVDGAFVSLCGKRLGDIERIKKLLFMTAKRGIPTIRKLSSGGTNALGEVGTLIALQALQGRLEDSCTVGILPAVIKSGENRWLNILVPMDAFRSRFEKLVREQLDASVKHPSRPDLIVFSIRCSASENTDEWEPVALKVSFIEVKARKGIFIGAGEALEQYKDIYNLFAKEDDNRLNRWARYDFLIAMLMFGLRVYESIPCIAKEKILNGLYPKLLRMIWGHKDFCSFEQQSRLFVVHQAVESSVNCQGLMLELSKSDAYQLFVEERLPTVFDHIVSTAWNLLASHSCSRNTKQANRSGTAEHLASTPTNSLETKPADSLAKESIKPIVYTAEEIPESEIFVAESMPQTEKESRMTWQTEDHPTVTSISEVIHVHETKPVVPRVEDDEEAYTILNGLDMAFQAYKINTSYTGTYRRTPNQLFFDFQGTSTCTISSVEKVKSPCLTSYGVEISRVEGRPHVVRIFVNRAKREVLNIKDVWQTYCYNQARFYEKGILLAVSEESGEPIYLNPVASGNPHSLIAGTTGSGKSVLLQNILLCLTVVARPEDVQVHVIDPKQVDFGSFESCPNVTCCYRQEDAIKTLNMLISEMERRYTLFRSKKVSKLSKYWATCKDGDEKLPQIWLIHDEFESWFSDESYRDAVTDRVKVLGSKARAAGIFLVFATQRPDKDSLPVSLRSNLTNRLILKVSDSGTSKICLGDCGGNWDATALMGKGHMIALLDDFKGLCQVPNVSEDIVESWLSTEG